MVPWDRIEHCQLHPPARTWEGALGSERRDQPVSETFWVMEEIWYSDSSDLR